MSKLSQAEIDALFAQYSAGGDITALAGAAAEAPAPGPASAPAPAAPSAPSAPVAQEVPVPVAFPPLELQPAQAAAEVPIGLISDVELEVTVRLGRTQRSIREILNLAPGSVLELDNLAGEAVDILVNGLLVAKGEVVVVGENYGVRIVELITPQGGQTA